MIAAVTAVTCEWLMGGCQVCDRIFIFYFCVLDLYQFSHQQVNSANITGDNDTDGLGVHVQRCR